MFDEHKNNNKVPVKFNERVYSLDAFPYQKILEALLVDFHFSPQVDPIQDNNKLENYLFKRFFTLSQIPAGLSDDQKVAMTNTLSYNLSVTSKKLPVISKNMVFFEGRFFSSDTFPDNALIHELFIQDCLASPRYKHGPYMYIINRIKGKMRLHNSNSTEQQRTLNIEIDKRIKAAFETLPIHVKTSNNDWIHVDPVYALLRCYTTSTAENIKRCANWWKPGEFKKLIPILASGLCDEFQGLKVVRRQFTKDQTDLASSGKKLQDKYETIENYIRSTLARHLLSEDKIEQVLNHIRPPEHKKINCNDAIQLLIDELISATQEFLLIMEKNNSHKKKNLSPRLFRQTIPQTSTQTFLDEINKRAKNPKDFIQYLIDQLEKNLVSLELKQFLTRHIFMSQKQSNIEYQQARENLKHTLLQDPIGINESDYEDLLLLDTIKKLSLKRIGSQVFTPKKQTRVK